MIEPERTDVTVRRTYQVYLYSVCFVSVIVLLFSGGIALYGFFKVILPGALSEGSHESIRRQGAAQLVQAGIFALVALVIFYGHWTRAAEARAELERVTSRAIEPPA